MLITSLKGRAVVGGLVAATLALASATGAVAQEDFVEGNIQKAFRTFGEACVDPQPPFQGAEAVFKEHGLKKTKDAGWQNKQKTIAADLLDKDGVKQCAILISEFSTDNAVRAPILLDLVLREGFGDIVGPAKSPDGDISWGFQRRPNFLVTYRPPDFDRQVPPAFVAVDTTNMKK
ncbi:MAG: hypothetical protein AAGB03_08505 [Pseudomonadota bacterium]